MMVVDLVVDVGGGQVLHNAGQFTINWTESKQNSAGTPPQTSTGSLSPLQNISAVELVDSGIRVVPAVHVLHVTAHNFCTADSVEHNEASWPQCSGSA